MSVMNEHGAGGPLVSAKTSVPRTMGDKDLDSRALEYAPFWPRWHLSQRHRIYLVSKTALGGLSPPSLIILGQRRRGGVVDRVSLKTGLLE